MSGGPVAPVTRQLRPYPQYGCFDDPWLDRIPSSWSFTKLGAVASVKARLGWRGLKASEYVDDGFIFLNTPNIKGTRIDFDDVDHITAERHYESPEIILREGDVLIAKDGSTLGIVNVVRSLPVPATVNSSIAVIRPLERLNSVYCFYFLASHYTQSMIGRMKDGMGVPHLFQADLRKFTILLPPEADQAAISEFLDRETARIDALIEKKERLITLLEEKRAALINRAVTKGLDPNAPMKDSGAPWLGTVPAHWELKQLKWAITFQRGHDLPSEERSAGAVPVVSSGGRSGDHSVAAACGPGIVTGRYGTIGQFQLIEGDYWPLNTTLYSTDLHGNDPAFLHSMLTHLAPLFLLNAVKSAVPGVDRNDVHPTLTAVPPIEEQRAIAHFLDHANSRIDRVTAKIREQIAKFHECRTALISAAVTGKIDVRDPGPAPAEFGTA